MKEHNFKEATYEYKEEDNRRPRSYSARKSEAAKDKDEMIINKDLLDGQFASNNWVISGKHTESGMPLLGSDPHLGSELPSVYHLQNIHWK